MPFILLQLQEDQALNAVHAHFRCRAPAAGFDIFNKNCKKNHFRNRYVSKVTTRKLREHFQCGIGYPIHMDGAESHKNSTTYSCMLRDRARLFIAITSSHMTSIFHRHCRHPSSSSSLSSANVTQPEARTNAVYCWCCNWVVSVEKLDEFVPSLWFFRSRRKPVLN